MQLCLRLEGLTRHASKHAAGVVISPEPLKDMLPLYVPSKTKDLVTQYAMSELESVGFLKMDFLGLKNLTVIEPVGFFSFLQLESKAKLVITDSGGVQEEACILGVPCVTIRDNTERSETLEVGANILAGASADRIVECVRAMLSKDRNWQNPFGDGRAAERICGIITGNNGG